MVFNIHPDPLPGYRGPDPVFWQIKNREPHASIAIHKVDDDFNTGSLVLSDKIRLNATDTHGCLTTKRAELAARLTGVLIKMAGFGIAIPLQPQDETKAIYYKKQSAADITINWQTMDAETIIGLANACNPWNKGAVTKLNNRTLRILVAEKHLNLSGTGKTPGSISVLEDKSIIVSTLHNETQKLQFVYVDEGFLNASRLVEMGLVSGSCFT